MTDSGSGGLVHSSIRGQPRKGKAAPFASATGSETSTSITSGGRYPTSSSTRPQIDSSRAAACRVQAADSAG